MIATSAGSSPRRRQASTTADEPQADRHQAVWYRTPPGEKVLVLVAVCEPQLRDGW
jgi:hypothetical protein